MAPPLPLPLLSHRPLLRSVLIPLRRSLTRANSSHQASANPSPKPEESPHRNFYTSFSRPVLKVFLMAFFTHQLLWWGWVKLENDEIKAAKTAEIEELEIKLATLKETKGQKKT